MPKKQVKPKNSHYFTLINLDLKLDFKSIKRIKNTLKSIKIPLSLIAITLGVLSTNVGENIFRSNYIERPKIEFATPKQPEFRINLLYTESFHK